MNKETVIKKYVLGFAFSLSPLDSAFNQAVLLLEKQHPEWQRGKTNGVGGKIEPGETPHHAMVREFAEAVKISTFEEEWREFCILSGEDWIVHCFCAFEIAIAEFEAGEDEVPVIYMCSHLPQHSQLLSSVQYLIPMALHDSNEQKPLYLSEVTTCWDGQLENIRLTKQLKTTEDQLSRVATENIRLQGRLDAYAAVEEGSKPNDNHSSQ